MVSSRTAHFKCRSVADRYARAVFELALETRRVDETMDELKRFDDALRTVHALRAALLDRELSFAKKHDIVREAAKVLMISPTVTNAIYLMIDKDRIPVFGETVILYQRMAEALAELSRVEAVVADRSFEASFKKDVERVLSEELGRTVVCDVKVDPSLIGGATVRIGDVSCDASVSGRLSQMRDELL